MNKNILMMVDALSNERAVDKEIIFSAIEAALAQATKKRYPQGDDYDIQVTIERETGDYATVRRWLVLEDEDPNFESPHRHVDYSVAQSRKPGVQVGEYIIEPVENAEFGRISASAAKQVIVQKVREAERAQIVDQYKGRIGELLTGLVKRLDKGAVIVDLGGTAEAIIPREGVILREPLRPGDRVRGYLEDVRSEPRGPQLFLSRTNPKYLMELFKLEVPEIAQGLIELKGAARDPGIRAKVAVKAKDKRIDPVGACVGMRGSRVQSVSNELAGERIDIVPWDDNPAQFVINAMAPAEVESIVVDEEAHAMSIAVAEDKLAQAIGRGGQNVRLASELTGWVLNVMTAAEAQEKTQSESQALVQKFVADLGVDEDIAAILVREGFTGLEEVAYVPAQELAQIEEFDDSIVEELRNRARDVLLTKAIATAETAADHKPGEDLLAVEGMDEDLAYKLAGHGILSAENLADLATDELVEKVPMEEARASGLIMAARAKAYA